MSAEECAEDQLFVCLYGAFELEDQTAEALPFDCRCLDRDPTTGRVPCSEHPNGTENPSNGGGPEASALWCGNCAIALIR